MYYRCTTAEAALRTGDHGSPIWRLIPTQVIFRWILFRLQAVMLGFGTLLQLYSIQDQNEPTMVSSRPAHLPRPLWQVNIWDYICNPTPRSWNSVVRYSI
jgi:hypothetical protein